ncbi:DUF3426 domain-containing protein [Marinobacter sp.]|jgi:predicted Zn finger-like uncharacterized protein|uniref:DUF3426 domain-containing protein n=1 Tax=Marinobacter sp. TaxID=50741 RepID=UPI001989917C|nr:DUF3426 domain-containing protein [Marinobacter sp.]MBC7192762.1 DUF3426 domain-containing protein [Marinobacter sp.]
MTESTLQTRCPECATRFQVSDEQLGIAKGKVRCGKCMAVFNAIEHKISDGYPTGIEEQPWDEHAPAASPDSQPSPQTPDDQPHGTDIASGFSADDDFVFADNPEEDAAEERYQGSTAKFSEDELSDSFLSLNESGKESDFREGDDTRMDKNTDESWAEAILEEESGGTPAGKSEAEPRHEQPEPEPEPAPHTTWAEPETPEPEPAQAGTATPASDSWRLAGNETPVSEPDPEPWSLSGSRARSPWEGLQRDPVPAYRRHHNRGRFRSMLWTLVVLTLTAGLISQVVWFQFDRLSAIPELRPLYEKGCALAGCQLAPLLQLDKIESRKLVVRTNPDNRNQLLVDAEIVNEAEFEQPFPAIALTFSNLNGDVVAQSLFTPDEYLAGEGKGLDTMVPGIPVRITISIRDPGRDAVNYNMVFRPNPLLQ